MGKATNASKGRVAPFANRRRLGRWAAALFVGLGVVAASGAADAAKVKGRIINYRLLQNPVWEDAKDAAHHGYSFREPVPTVRAEFRRLFPHIPKEICIAALAATPQKHSEPILVRVGGGRTTPVTIVVPPGTRLQFQNTDPFTHRLYGVDIKTFQPNDTVKGGTRDWTVPGPGVFEIRDQLAPSLRMFVVGEPKVAAIAYPSLDGEFALNLAEAGAYKVQPYFAGKPVGTASTITVEGRDLDISKAPIKVASAKKKSDKDEEK